MHTFATDKKPENDSHYLSEEEAYNWDPWMYKKWSEKMRKNWEIYQQTNLKDKNFWILQGRFPQNIF